MSSNGPFILRLVSSSVAIANRAGRLVRSIVKTGELKTVDKSGGKGQYDPQTEADRSAERCIVGSLQQKFPGLRIIGEENVDASNVESDLVETAEDDEVLQQTCPEELMNIKPEDVIVWVDPVDGTKEFSEGLLHFATVLIGVSWQGRPIAGVIHQPFYGCDTQTTHLGRTVWAIKNIGVFGIKHVPPAINRCIVTTTRSHPTKLVADVIEAMKPDEVLRVGGSGYKVLQVMDGTADAYVFASRGTKRWDTCAGEALIESVGGKLTDMLGQEIKYEIADSYLNKYGVLAAVQNHMSFLEKVPESVKKGLVGK